MRTLVISDLHLTSKFEKQKYEYLKSLFCSVDQVVINGDFWCMYKTSFKDFVNSDWKKLFPTLKSKNTFYVTGNHDYKDYVDKNYKLFAEGTSEEYRFGSGDKTYVVKHGHTISPFKSDLSPKGVKKYKKYKVVDISYFLQKRFLKYMGSDLLHWFVRRQNQYFKQFAKKQLKPNEILVCGHSHLMEFNLPEKFINTGFVWANQASYLVLENGFPKLLRERY